MCYYLYGDSMKEINGIIPVYKEKGMTLIDALEAIYKEFGYYTDSLYNFVFEGASGMVKMQEIALI